MSDFASWAGYLERRLATEKGATMSNRFLAVVFCVLALFAAAPAHDVAAQTVTAEQERQMADFAYFVRAFEAEFGPMRPDLKQRMIAAASDQILQGNYEGFMAGLRQSIGVPPDFGAPPAGAPSGAPTGPTSADQAIVGMRVFYLQRSPLGRSGSSGYVHFCPGGFFYESTEATISLPTTASANVNAGSWRVENGRDGPVVGIYYQNGPRTGQRIEYKVSDMTAGRWRTTNWDYAVDRQAFCPPS